MEVTGTVAMILHQKGTTVWSIGPDAMVFEAIRLMAEKNVGALPVMEGGRLIGILSERDYTRNVMLKGKSSKETPVRDIMTSHPLVAKPGDSIAECMWIMTESRLRHLPVLNDNAIVGILSMG